MRISYLISIYTALHTYLADEVVDRWVGLANGHSRFGGRRPLACMAAGGVDALREVCGMINAWRGTLMRGCDDERDYPNIA